MKETTSNINTVYNSEGEDIYQMFQKTTENDHFR
jgi:hypothetical protein